MVGAFVRAQREPERSRAMARMMCKRFDHADEVRPFKNHGRAEIVNFGGGSTVGRGVFEPGWRWSQDVKPIAKTESCQAAHTQYCVSGRMRIRMDDGEELEVGPGDVAVIPPGHDAWVIGSAPCVMLDFSGMENYARMMRGTEVPAPEPVMTH
jgi:hypothetical protein